MSRPTSRQVRAVAAPLQALLQHLVLRLLIVAGICLLAFSPPNHAQSPQPHPTICHPHSPRV
jgi:hypothetical protein